MYKVRVCPDRTMMSSQNQLNFVAGLHAPLWSNNSATGICQKEAAQSKYRLGRIFIMPLHLQTCMTTCKVKPWWQADTSLFPPDSCMFCMEQHSCLNKTRTFLWADSWMHNAGGNGWGEREPCLPDTWTVAALTSTLSWGF